MMLAASSLPLCTACWGELSLEHQLPKHLVPWLRNSAVVHPPLGREGWQQDTPCPVKLRVEVC